MALWLRQPTHSPRIERDDDQDIEGHAENDVKDGHEQNSLLQDDRLQEDLQREEYRKMDHRHGRQQITF